jgi:hypothetical protein
LPLWGHALIHAAHVHNFLPHVLLPHSTPAELWALGNKPDVSHLRVWGCTAYVLLNRDQQRLGGGKMAPKALRCAYLGHNPSSPGYLFLNPNTGATFGSGDVIFDETTFFWSNTFSAPSL